MLNQTSSSFPLRKLNFAAAKSKLKSCFTNPGPRQAISASPHTQIHSQLLSTLPLEIRRQIYAHVLDSYQIVQHILLSEKGKLTHMRCVSPASHTHFQTARERFAGICNTHDIAYRNSTKHKGWETVLPLLLSCRQIYLEFIELLYSSARFYLNVSAAATRFIATVPAPQLALAYLHLSYTVTEPMYQPPLHAANSNPNSKPSEAEWEAFWRAFAPVRVRALVLEILDFGEPLPPEQALLRPLREKMMVMSGSFEVLLPWPTGLETSGEFKGAVFTVRRPPQGKNVMLHLEVAKAYPGPPQGRGVLARLRRW